MTLHLQKLDPGFDVVFMVNQRRMEMQQEEEGETTAGSVLAKIKLEKYATESESSELLAREYTVRARWNHHTYPACLHFAPKRLTARRHCVKRSSTELLYDV